MILNIKMKKLIFASTLLIAFGSACGQTRPSNQTQPQQKQLTSEQLSLCRSAENQIDDSLKNIAHENISGIGDNSAPRETNRQLRVVSAYSNINVQLVHMQTINCPALAWSINPGAYTHSALSCEATRLVGKEDEIKEKCSKAAWRRIDS